MINKLKDMIKERNIEVIYANLPLGTEVLYTVRQDSKYILLNKIPRDVETDNKNVALGIGYYESFKTLDVEPGDYDVQNKEKNDLLNKMAEIYRDELLDNLRSEI